MGLECELKQQVERLGSRDRSEVRDARKVLIGAGEAGVRAAIRGLAHSNASVRRGCADFMDDHRTEACVEPLLQVAQIDPVAEVRRAAVHSLGCQRCKVSPVQVDVVSPLIEIALSDESPRVRRVAVGLLGEQPPDPRAAIALQAILSRETTRRLWMVAHWALRRHNPVAPEPSDLVAPLIQRALSNESARVRREAVRSLGQHPPAPRIVTALWTFMSRETDPSSLMTGHRALMRHDAEYGRAHIEKRKARRSDAGAERVLEPPMNTE